MFVQTINPYVFQIGESFGVRWYGLIYAFGFLITYLWLLHVAKLKKVKNLTVERAEQFFLFAILGTVVGARFFDFVFYNPKVLITDPLEVLRIWHGGLSFHGGLIGMIIVCYVFYKKYRVDMLELGDALVIPASLALAFGRIANFINSELVGKITDVSWCVEFPLSGKSGCRHPSQLYESLKNFTIFTILITTWKKEKRKKGLLTGLFIIFYGLFRFIVNFWRDDPPLIGNVSTGQVLSLVMCIMGVIFVGFLHREEIKKFIKSKQVKK